MKYQIIYNIVECQAEIDTDDIDTRKYGYDSFNDIPLKDREWIVYEFFDNLCDYEKFNIIHWTKEVWDIIVNDDIYTEICKFCLRQNLRLTYNLDVIKKFLILYNEWELSDDDIIDNSNNKLKLITKKGKKFLYKDKEFNFFDEFEMIDYASSIIFAPELFWYSPKEIDIDKFSLTDYGYWCIMYPLYNARLFLYRIK